MTAYSGTSNGELEKFVMYRSIVSRQLEETKANLKDVDFEEHFDKVLCATTILNAAREVAFTQMLNIKPTLIIVGLDSYAKSALLNELLEQCLLPTTRSEAEASGLLMPGSDGQWPTIHITYGGRTGIHYRPWQPPNLSTSASANSLHKTVFIPYKLSGYTGQRSELSPDAVPIPASYAITGERHPSPQPSNAFPSLRRSIAEVQIRHALVKNGNAEILLLNYTDGADSLSQAVDDHVHDGLLPILVYAMCQDQLQAQDISDLANLKEKLGAWPVLVVRASPFLSSDLLPESDRFTACAAAWATVLDSSVESSMSSNSFEQHSSTIPAGSRQIPFSINQLAAAGRKRKQTPTAGGFVGGGAGSVGSGGSLGHRSSSAKTRMQTLTTLAQLGFLKLTRQPTPGVPATPTGAPPPTDELSSAALLETRVNFWQPISAQQTQEVNFTSITNPSNYIDKLRSDYVDEPSELSVRVAQFVRQVLRMHLVYSAASLHEIHTRLLRLFILTAFDMARDQIITPRRITFAKTREAELYASLIDIVQGRHELLKKLVADSVLEAKPAIVESAACYSPTVSDEIPLHRSPTVDQAENGSCSLTSSTNSVNKQRLSRSDLREVAKECAAQIQHFVALELAAAISDRLQASFACLRQTFIETVSRCLASLESTDIQGTSDCLIAIRAFSDILNVAYNIDISIEKGTSLISLILDKMKRMLTLSSFSTDTLDDGTIVASKDWKRRIAADALSRLAEGKIAKSIFQQLQHQLKTAHETFQAAMTRLEATHNLRLNDTEAQRLKLRKGYAPRLARLTMESLALRDSLLYGMPKLGPEIGRGQYGVVYSCEKWGPYTPCAVKSVVPPDEKHWNDLAMEFFYTNKPVNFLGLSIHRNLPEHDRIVRLHGAVIDLNYGAGGSLPAVLLIMERLKRDFYTAIKAGLSLVERIQVTLDVVDGMRFLHSQGLVHRDIKLKNVLLNDANRGKITDLGFCKPEAMMSGSIVGTPIHMAPELFSGQYDSSVDVYAFGVLFWYVCAGHVKLPQSFEECVSKDQLWMAVRKGKRPEKLPEFDEDCWDIMMQCWSPSPTERPLLGDIQPKLEAILVRLKQTETKQQQR